MMQPQSTLFRGPNEHVGPLKKDQCALTPKTCPLRKALRWGEGWGEGVSDFRLALAPSPGSLRDPTSPQWGEVARVAPPCAMPKSETSGQRGPSLPDVRMMKFSTSATAR